VTTRSQDEKKLETPRPMITLPQLAPKDHTPPPISNRESEAAIFAPRRPLQGAKGEQKANREPLRLEIDVTPTKQRLGLRSNRELEAFFFASFCHKNTAPPAEKGEQKANREPLRLEINVTPTKQRPDHLSNREKMTLLSNPFAQPYDARRHDNRSSNRNEND
jgi:hypothetical protein